TDEHGVRPPSLLRGIENIGTEASRIELLHQIPRAGFFGCRAGHVDPFPPAARMIWYARRDRVSTQRGLRPQKTSRPRHSKSSASSNRPAKASCSSVML